MAIERLQRKEFVDPRGPQVDFGAPAVGDFGAQARNLGRSLLQTADPILKAKREEEGATDAAQAPLMKDAEGNVLRAEPLPGGGRVYTDAFRNAASTLYKGRLMSDYEIAIGNIVAANKDDPQRAWKLMQAHTEAVAKTVPPDILTDIEPAMLRESTQQFNYLNYGKVKQDHANLVAGHEALYGEKQSAYINARRLAVANQDLALVAELDKNWDEFAAESRRARTELNELTPQMTAAEQTAVDSKRLTMGYEINATVAMRTFTERTAELVADPKQLQLMTKWVTGPISTDPNEKVLGMTYDEYVKFLSTPEAVNEMGRFAQGLISDIDAAAAAAKAQAQEDKDAKKDEQQQFAQDALGALSVAGDKDAEDSYNDKINRVIVGNGGNITNFMSRPDGAAYMQDQVRQTGVLPKALKVWLDATASGTNLHQAAEFLANIMDAHDDKLGWATGINAFNQIDKTARGFIMKYMELADAGFPTAQRRQMIEDIIHGDFEKKNMAAAFDKADHKNGQKLYVEQRNSYSLAMFGMNYDALPTDMQTAIDTNGKAFLSAYGQDPKSAVRASIQMVATLWTPNTKGVQGFIPTELAELGLTDSQLDRAFGNYVDGKGHVYGGAGFTTFTDSNSGHLPRARIQLNDESQLMRGLGNYTVYYYDRQGNQIGSPRHVNIDQVMAAHFGGLQKLEEKTKAARHDLWKKRRDAFRDALNKASMQEPVLKPRRGRDY